MFHDWSGFGEEWDEWKVIDTPPSGTADDVWGTSQRSIIHRAMIETPELLRWAVQGQDSWYGVVGRVLEGLREMGEQIPDPESHDASPRDSTYRLKEILDIIKDS